MRPRRAGLLVATAFGLWFVPEGWLATDGDLAWYHRVLFTAVGVLALSIVGLVLNFLRMESRTLLGPALGFAAIWLVGSVALFDKPLCWSASDGDAEVACVEHVECDCGDPHEVTTPGAKRRPTTQVEPEDPPTSG